MIIKSKSRQRGSWRQLLSYMEQGSDERSILITHNVRSNDTAHQEEEFREAEQFRSHRRKGSVVLYHEIISFHDLDNKVVTAEKLEDMVLQYIYLRAERGLVVARSHQDRDHIHVHLCISGVQYATGKSMRMSRSQFTAIKRTMQGYQQENYPEIKHSIADHGRRARQVRSEREYMMKQRTGERSKREILSEELRALFARSSSLEGFKRSLNEQGMELYLRNGRPQGVRVEGVKYRLSSIGITKDEIERTSRAPKRMREIQRIRERGREVERDRSSAKRPSRGSRREALGEPEKQ